MNTSDCDNVTNGVESGKKTRCAPPNHLICLHNFTCFCCFFTDLSVAPAFTSILHRTRSLVALDLWCTTLELEKVQEEVQMRE